MKQLLHISVRKNFKILRSFILVFFFNISLLFCQRSLHKVNIEKEIIKLLNSLQNVPTVNKDLESLILKYPEEATLILLNIFIKIREGWPDKMMDEFYKDKTICRLLAKIGEPAVDKLLEELKLSKNKWVKMGILDILGEIKSIKGYNTIVDIALKENDYGIQVSAIEALGKISREKSLNVFKEILIKGGAVEFAGSELLRVGISKSIPLLIDVMKDIKACEVGRRWATNLLIRIGEPSVVPLIDILNSEDSYTKWLAIFALREIGDTRAIEPIEKMLNDRDISVKKLTIDTLAKIGNHNLLPKLKLIAKEDPLGEIRLKAAVASRKLRINVISKKFIKYGKEIFGLSLGIKLCKRTYYVHNDEDYMMIKIFIKNLSNRTVSIPVSSLFFISYVKDKSGTTEKIYNYEQIDTYVIRNLNKKEELIKEKIKNSSVILNAGEIFSTTISIPLYFYVNKYNYLPRGRYRFFIQYMINEFSINSNYERFKIK